MTKDYSLRVPKAAELVAQSLHNRIVVEQLVEGYRMPTETELTEAFGVSRATIREALRLLEHDGLIEIRRGVNGGNFVRHPDIMNISKTMSLLFGVRAATLRDFVEFRLLVEPAAAEMASLRIKEHQVLELERVANVGSELEHVPDLHMLIANASGNQILGVMLNALHHTFGLHFRPNLISNDQLRDTQAAHKKIARLIINKDSSGAKHAMSVHLEAYAQYLEDMSLIDAPLVPRQVTSDQDKNYDTILSPESFYTQ